MPSVYAPVAGTARTSPRCGSGGSTRSMRASPDPECVPRTEKALTALALLAANRDDAARRLCDAVRKQSRVLRAVELRARIVRHAAVNRDVRGLLARPFDDTDAVEGHSRSPDQGTARLED